MATAAATPGNRVPFVTSAPGRRYDHFFFSGMAVLMLATVFVGFARTYYLAGMVRATLPSAHHSPARSGVFLLDPGAGRANFPGRCRPRGYPSPSRHFRFSFSVCDGCSRRPGGHQRTGQGLCPARFRCSDVLRDPDHGHADLSHPDLFRLPQPLQSSSPQAFHPDCYACADDCAHRTLASCRSEPGSRSRQRYCLPLFADACGYDLWSIRKVHRVTLWAGAFLIVVQQIEYPLGKQPPGTPSPLGPYRCGIEVSVNDYSCAVGRTAGFSSP